MSVDILFFIIALSLSGGCGVFSVSPSFLPILIKKVSNMSENIKEKEKKQKEFERKTKKFMKVVRKFLASKNGGEVAPEWECGLLMLETYYSQFIRLNDEVDSLDSLIEVGRYGPQPSPLLKARDATAVRLEALMKQLGLTLKSALTMDIAEPIQEESPLESFVKNKIEKR